MIVVPEWMVWMFAAMFCLQWILNAILAYYKAKCAKSWDQLDETTKRALGGKVMPRHAQI